MGALMGKGALVLWLDVAPEMARETDGWCIDEHMPERIDVGGYLRARRYGVLEGAPTYLTLFEAQTPEALASEGYLRLVGQISEQSRRIRAGFSNVVRNTFAVRQSRGRGMGAILASLRLTPVSVARAEEPSLGECPARAHTKGPRWPLASLASAARAEAAVAALDAQVPQLLRRHGVVGVHWLEAAPDVRVRMDAVRAVGQSDASADYALLIEATRLADVEAIRRDAVSAVALAGAGWVEQSFAIYGLLYEVSTFAKGVETNLGDRA